MNDKLEKPLETPVELPGTEVPDSDTSGLVEKPSAGEQSVVAGEQAPTWLDRSLASVLAWDWEKTAWLALLIVAAVIRLVALNNRTASHDESEHAWFAYNLYAGKGYEHSPVYHGPFIYHVMGWLTTWSASWRQNQPQPA